MIDKCKNQSYDSQLIRKTEEGNLLLYYFPSIILDLDYTLSIHSSQNNKQNILFIALVYNCC